MGKRLIACLILAILVATSAEAYAGYSRELRKVTKQGNIYHVTDWSAELIWRATFFSDEFRKAFEKQHAKLRFRTRPEVEQYIAEQEMRQANGWEFLVSVYTRKAYRNISNYEDTFWKIYVITESGKRIAPTEVEQVKITPYERKMLPYLDRWSRLYLVVFPKVDIGDDFKLQMESVVGGSTLNFYIR